MRMDGTDQDWHMSHDDVILGLFLCGRFLVLTVNGYQVIIH